MYDMSGYRARTSSQNDYKNHESRGGETGMRTNPAARPESF